MNQQDIEGMFPNRRSVEDSNDMQIFRTPIQAMRSDAIADHAASVLACLLYGVPSITLSPKPQRHMAGVVYQTARQGKFPARWRIEYLMNRWFMEQTLRAPGDMDTPLAELVTECRLIVDYWVSIPEPLLLTEGRAHR